MSELTLGTEPGPADGRAGEHLPVGAPDSAPPTADAVAGHSKSAATKPKKAKSKGKSKGKERSANGASVATHPRARVHVRQAKGWGGLAGFAIAAYLSYRAGVSPDLLGLRAIGCGVAGYMLAWACSVMVWRALLLAELRAHTERHHSTPTIPSRAPAPSGAPPAASE